MEIKEQSEREWSKWSDHNVVMRATSFGQGQNGLEVCARRREYNVPGNDNRNVTREGLHDDVIIPLGLMATLRRQMKKDNKLPNNCWEPWKG